MYLVELRPGKEELYRSGDELAAAIRRGDVDVHSRIYHRATSKWISVTLHPQFKAIVAQKAVEPLPPLERNNWTYLTDQAETLHVAEGGNGMDGGSGEVPSTFRSHPWRRLFGLGVAGTALVLGAQLAFSGPRPPWAGDADVPALQPADAVEEPVEAPQVVSLASSSSAWQPKAPAAEPSVVPAPRPDSTRSHLPRAPQLRLKTLKDVLPAAKPAGTAVDANTIEGLLSRYGTAYGAARERLETGIRVARLHQLFAPARLAPDGGLTDTRLGLAGVANFIRVYRQQETAIEQEYQDTFTVLAKQHAWSARAVRRWYARGAQKEPAAFATLSNRLLASLDSLLGVLDEEAGAYQLGEGTIAFEDIEAMRRYGVLRKEITQMIDTARAAGGEESAGPMGQLLNAVGTTQLPREI